MTNRRKTFLLPITGALLLAAFGLLLFAPAGCSKQVDVLEKKDIDKLPALVQVVRRNLGYQLDDLLLVLIPTLEEKVRVTRTSAEVIVYLRKNKWLAPAEGQQAELLSIDYRFPTISEIERDGIYIRSSLGLRERVQGQRADVLWFRVGQQHSMINTEIAFDTQPVTVHKATYYPADNGFTAILEAAATLKIR
ncbi:MAG: hypothetical protein ACTSXZ_01040 [Alphaproteobacteria bacterium]